MRHLCHELYQGLKSQLHEVHLAQHPPLREAQECFSCVHTALDQLKEKFTGYDFTPPEEIYFFKQVKPRFVSEQIYYGELYYMHSTIPLEPKEIAQHFKRQLAFIRSYFQRHHFLYTYFRLDRNDLDEYLFRRNAPKVPFLPDKPFIQRDAPFSTLGSYRFSRFKAYSRLKEHLHQQIRTLKNPETATGKARLKWTAPKVALIELTYALKAAGVFNNGQATIRDIATVVEKVFQQDMSQYYRTFQEIRIRKSGRTHFLKRLTHALEKWMDNTDLDGKGEKFD